MKIFETIFILHKCRNALNLAWELYHGQVNKGISRYQVILTDYIILEYVNFFEEFNRNPKFLEPAYSDRMLTVRKIAKPILARIKKWKHLNYYRNHIVAHTYRDGQNFVVPDSNKHIIPRNAFEIVQLVHYVNYIFAIVESEFKEEFPKTFQYVAGMLSEPPVHANYSGINSELEKMASEVAEICASLGKPFPIKLVGFWFS